jgi:hypothetical protein
MTNPISNDEREPRSVQRMVRLLLNRRDEWRKLADGASTEPVKMHCRGCASGVEWAAAAISVNGEWAADTERMDALEAMPYAMEIKYNPEQPKADSVPSLRSQIDHFLSLMAKQPNDESSATRRTKTHEHD